MNEDTATMKQLMQEEAIRAAGPQVQQVWEESEKQRKAGGIPYHPQLNLRVIFEPKFGGGYDAELRPVSLDPDQAKKTGSDFWSHERGCWVIRGWKPEADHRAPAVAGVKE